MALRVGRPVRIVAGLVGVLAMLSALSACKGGSAGGIVPGALTQNGNGASMSRQAPPMSLVKLPSTSPALVPAPAMASTTILPPSAMTAAGTMKVNQRTGARAHVQTHAQPMQSISGSSWTLVPAAASQVVASPDGTLWALGAGTGDRAIWHYSGGSAGTWTNISGAATNLAVSPSGALYAVNAEGGIYQYNANSSSWTTIAGGASAVAIGADASIYVLSNGGVGDHAIWHSTDGGATWTELAGSGVAISANWDPNTHTVPGGSVTPGGFYIINAEGYIYYGTSGGTFVAFNGGASGVASTAIGGLFVIGYPVNNALGNQVYYWNLNNAGGGWQYQTGAGLSVSANGNAAYVAAVGNAIYESTITGSGRAAGPGTALSGPAYGPAAICGVADTVSCGYAAEDIAAKLDYPVQQGYDGRGITIAIVIDSDLAAGDLAAYETYNQTPATGRTVTTESVDGGTGVTAGPGQGEATLDEETIAGLAPGANIILYETPDLSGQSINDAYNKIISDGVAKVVSSSFGGCESAGMAGEDTILATGAQDGIAWMASAGDQGNECYNGTGYQQGANSPASDTYVIGVGGNETYPTSGDAVTNPVVWNDTNCGGPCAGGGGVSAYWALPGYQQSLSGVTSSAFRNEPDITMPAEYTATYENGAWGLQAGTSWSSPEFAAMMAEIYEYCGTSFEDAPALIYNVYRAVGYSAFIDVTSGNDQFGGASPFYTAGTGYDNASGIGIPEGVAFGNAACPSNQPASIVMRPDSSVQYAVHRPAEAYSVNVTPAVHGLVDLGRRSPSALTRIQIVLRPTSTLAADEQSVISTLSGAGFTIAETFSDHLVVDATAPSGTVERFFGTSMHDVAQGTYGTRYMPESSVTVPASLAPYVSGINLDNVVTMFARPISMAARHR